MMKAAAERFLIVGHDSFAEAVISLPAIKLFREAYPEADLTLTAPSHLADFWSMCPLVDRVLLMGKTGSTLIKLRKGSFDRAYILPDTFRAAYLPFMARIPRRIGARGRWRRMMLTEIVHPGSGHRQFEVMTIFGVNGNPPPPELIVPVAAFDTLERKLCHVSNLGENRPAIFQALEACAAAGGHERAVGSRPVVMLMPVAGKVELFSLLIKKLCATLDAVILLGGGPDSDLACEELAAIEPRAINLAGETTRLEWAAVLQMSDCVVAPPCDGLHLASAVGTPFVGLFDGEESKNESPLGKQIILPGRGEPGHSPSAVTGAVKELLAGAQWELF